MKRKLAPVICMLILFIIPAAGRIFTNVEYSPHKIQLEEATADEITVNLPDLEIELPQNQKDLSANMKRRNCMRSAMGIRFMDCSIFQRTQVKKCQRLFSPMDLEVIIRSVRNMQRRLLRKDMQSIALIFAVEVRVHLRNVCFYRAGRFRSGHPHDTGTVFCRQ